MWFGLAPAWDEGGLPRGGLVWFGPHLGRGGQPGGGLVWFGAYLGLTMVAAHMKKASTEAGRRKREASQGKFGLVWSLPGKREASHEEVWFGLAPTSDSQWWRRT